MLLVGVAVLAPWLAPTDPSDNDLSIAMQAPGQGLVLGADDQGRDMITRLLYGLRLTLLIGVAAVGLGGSVGSVLGLLAAFYRRLDGVIMRCMDVMLSFPAILFGLAIAAIFGAGDAADSYLNPNTLDYDPQSKDLLAKFDPAAARKLLDENGWVPGPDGVRVKDGVRASFLLYGIIDAQWNRASEAIQADLKRIGVEMRIQLFDATVAWGKLATQEFGAFVMSYPYVSASDALSLYFASANTPTPNRMNWKNADTDKWLVEGRTALDPAIKREALANVQRQVTEANVWVPLVREQLWVASAKRVAGARAHGMYGVGVYKGLDITVGK